MGKRLDFALAVLNGTVGDYLARTGNGLATPMTLVHGGEPIAPERANLARVHPKATGRIAILVPGVMCTEEVFRLPDGSDYGALLARDLGVTPLYVRYNTGRAIEENGADFAELLSKVVEAWPVAVDEILPIGFSMGGLVVRSACHVAAERNLPWLPRIRRAIYLGTPHLGAPLERLGRLVTRVLTAIPDPYTRLIAEIGDLRSMGIKDLGNADLRAEDRARRSSAGSVRDPRHPVPLLPSMRHYLIAGSLSDVPVVGALVGDALVPVPSATFAEDAAMADAARALPPSHVKIYPGAAHLSLAHRPDVYDQIRAWCEEP